MESKRFVKNDNGFVCEVCGAIVPPLNYSSRDHCNVCLSSIHVDELPGDRTNICCGILEPCLSEPHPKKDFIIIYKCKKCGKTHRNCSAADDDRRLLIKLTNPDR